MATRPTKPINRSGQVSASELQRLAKSNYGQDGAAGSGDIFTFSSGSGLQIGNLNPGEIWIQIGNGSNDGAYDWIQQRDDGKGGLENDTAGMAGTMNDVPAYEVNGANDVSDGTYVRAKPAADGMSLLFDENGGDTFTFTVETANGSLIIDPVNKIKIGANLSLANDGNGVVTIDGMNGGGGGNGANYSFDGNQFNDSFANGVHNISIKTVPFSGTFLTNAVPTCNANGTLSLALSNDTISGFGVNAP